MNSALSVNDCFANSAALLSHDAAVATLRARLAPVTGVERVSLWEASDRVVAEAVDAPLPVPFHTNAAVDGYAFAADEAANGPDGTRAIVGRAAAGHPHPLAHIPGSAIRILTGAVMPQGTDTVAMQEDVTLSDDGRFVRLPSNLKRGANVRQAGEDIARGTRVFSAGHLLRPQDLAALASMGVQHVDCRKRLKVAILATGDEVRPAGHMPLAMGEVYDANSPMLAALARLAGANVTMLGILRDDRAIVESTLRDAARDFDVVLTSGGASRGEEDHIAAVLDKIGTRHFWQIAVKPGRPMMFGQVGRSIVVGLPGNPVAVFVCFLMYVHPMLRRLGGAPWPEPRRFFLPAAFEVPGRKLGRREFWRGVLHSGPDGLSVEKFPRDGSGLITGLRVADGLIDIAEDLSEVRRGDRVAFIPFSEFGITPQSLASQSGDDLAS